MDLQTALTGRVTMRTFDAAKALLLAEFIRVTGLDAQAFAERVKAAHSGMGLIGELHGMKVAVNVARREAGMATAKQSARSSCSRCGGLGYIEAFRGVAGGACFKCAPAQTIRF